MSNINKLLEVMRKLRDPQDGCPWDLEQDFELGDLLFQVAFHARMAEEAGFFDFEDVAKGISDKMVRRHPHVFGSDAERAQGQQDGSWEQIKEDERSDTADNSALAGVAKGLPALKRAEKLGNRASRAGFDWPDRQGVRDKIQEELEELEEAVGMRDVDDMEEEFGDVLFAVVNLARHLNIDPEKALTSANYKFERRFRDMEIDIADTGKRLKNFNLETLDKFWRAAKKRVG